MKNLSIILVALTFLSSCNDEDRKNSEEENSEKIVIAGKELTLSIYLWRDFMPDTEENGSPLMGSIRFIGQSGNNLLNTVSISKVFVVNNRVKWVCRSFEKRIIGNDVLEIVFGNGPKWEPGINVDVVCEFKYQGRLLRHRSKSQRINQTH